MEWLNKLRNFRIRKYSPKDFNQYLEAGFKAIKDNIPEGYEINTIRVQLDPDFDFSSIDYSLEKKSAE